jgi:hypothetical protein
MSLRLMQISCINTFHEHSVTKWGICFNDEFSYSTEKRLAKQVQYATKISLEKAMND